MLVNALMFLINFIIKAVGLFIGILISVLPNSPFLILQNLEFEYLDTLNWVLPLSFSLTVLSYWLAAIALYYLIQIPLRVVKVVS